jgi:hypothetical protein
MPTAHIAYRVDHETLIKNPEQVLQKMSFKIFEKRQALFEQMIDKKIKFKTSKGVEQGTCIEISPHQCQVKVGNHVQKISLNKILF